MGPQGDPGPQGPAGPQGEPGWVDIGAIIDSVLQALPPGVSIEVYEGDLNPGFFVPACINTVNIPWSASDHRHRLIDIPGGLRSGDQLIGIASVRQSVNAPLPNAIMHTLCGMIMSDNLLHTPSTDIGLAPNLRSIGPAAGSNDNFNPANNGSTHWSHRTGSITYDGPDITSAYVGLFARSHTTTPAAIGHLVDISPSRLTLLVLRNP